LQPLVKIITDGCRAGCQTRSLTNKATVFRNRKGDKTMPEIFQGIYHGGAIELLGKMECGYILLQLMMAVQ